MRLFADTADFGEMQRVGDAVEGFTTNPTLMRAAGVKKYECWARSLIEFFPTHKFNFEVIADDDRTVERQAYLIASWGRNVFVKVPVIRTDGSSTDQLVRSLVAGGVRVNVTAICTRPQVEAMAFALDGNAESILSIFAGRIADTGRNPVALVTAAHRAARANTSVLWASAREILNVEHAAVAYADIITLSPELLDKRWTRGGMSLDHVSRETVQQFHDDAMRAGLTLDTP